MKKALFIMLIIAAAAAHIVNNSVTFISADILHLPSGVVNAGYHRDFSAAVIYGHATPVSFTDRFIAAWIGDIAVSVSQTNKWYTNDASEHWTVYNVELCRGIDGDDAWINLEFGF